MYRQKRLSAHDVSNIFGSASSEKRACARYWELRVKGLSFLIGESLAQQVDDV